MKKIEKLENGLMLITHKLPNTHSVTISANFRVGSIYENIHNNGISHLVEHMFFRKLSKLSQSELYLKVQSIGTEIIGLTYNRVLNKAIFIYKVKSAYSKLKFLLGNIACNHNTGIRCSKKSFFPLIYLIAI